MNLDIQCALANNANMMKDPIQLETCLVSAKKDAAPTGSEQVESVETGLLVRPMMKMTNLDFIYVFDQPLAAKQVHSNVVPGTQL